MNSLYTQAIKKASEIRLRLGRDLFQPVNIYDLCAELEIDVQFIDLNMEGLYINSGGEKRILISCLRPFPRRVFTCGHELGHHIFNHGLMVDIITDEAEDSARKSPEEILVDTFSAHLLMPVAGIKSEFTNRNLGFHTVTSLDFYKISSIFGVGYQSLITHCKVNNLISDAKSMELLKLTPAKIFKNAFGEVEEKSYFKIIDGTSELAPIDLEVSNYLVLPSGFVVDEAFFEKKKETELGNLFQAKKPGISSVHSNLGISYFVRVQPQNYIGFAEYRHIEN